MKRPDTMNDKELQIAMLRKIAELRQIRLDDFLPSFLRSYEPNPNLIHKIYEALTPRCLRLLQTMYAKHGWITCYFTTRNIDDDRSVIDENNIHRLEIRIEPRGEEYLKKGKNLFSDLSQTFSINADANKERNRGEIRTIASIIAEDKYRYSLPKDSDDARKIIAEVIASRRGQRKFRRNLLEAYGSKCLITGPNTEEILEAAHIRAYSTGGAFDVSNGLLLRADIHTLFDLGLIAIDTKDLTVITHSSLKDTSYREYEGQPLLISHDSPYRPDREALDEHRRESRIKS